MHACLALMVEETQGVLAQASAAMMMSPATAQMSRVFIGSAMLSQNGGKEFP
jgi:hypothetical protein